MSQADVVPIGTRGRPGRGSSATRTPSAASRSLAGNAAAAPAPPPAGDRPTPPPSARATRPATDTDDRAGSRSTTVGHEEPTTGAHQGDESTAHEGFELPSSLTELLALVGDTAYAALGPDADRLVAEGLGFLRRRLTGDYGVDLFGLDSDLTETVVLPLLRPLFESYFRVEVKGVENLPDDSGALIVANHSGTIAVDAVMTALAVHDHTPSQRILRMLGADFVYSLPVVGEMARKTGSTLACAEDAHRLLTAGELVGVWPEGFKGIGKPYRERYRLQRFGRGGFVSSAVTAGVPIIPTAIVGAEEIYPIIGNLPLVARLLGAPYFPVTPTFPWLGPLGLLPLPSKWIIEFGEPIETDDLGPEEADDPMVVFNLGDQVRETIQQKLYQLLQERRSVFF